VAARSDLWRPPSVPKPRSRITVVSGKIGDDVQPRTYRAAADLYITPYLNEAQITSGTLAYAFGAGKAVVSTPYWHAAELLAEDRGTLMPFGDAPAIAREVTGLLRDDTRRHAIRKNAYRIGREMVWSNVAQMYMRSFECSRLEGAARTRRFLATKTLDQKPRELPPMNLSHLSQMTDSTGVFQDAVFSIPSFAEGYCTDDNARAFVLSVLLGELARTRTPCGHWPLLRGFPPSRFRPSDETLPQL